MCSQSQEDEMRMVVVWKKYSKKRQQWTSEFRGEREQAPDSRVREEQAGQWGWILGRSMKKGRDKR